MILKQKGVLITATAPFLPAGIYGYLGWIAATATTVDANEFDGIFPSSQFEVFGFAGVKRSVHCAIYDHLLQGVCRRIGYRERSPAFAKSLFVTSGEKDAQGKLIGRSQCRFVSSRSKTSCSFRWMTT